MPDLFADMPYPEARADRQPPSFDPFDDGRDWKPVDGRVRSPAPPPPRPNRPQDVLLDAARERLAAGCVDADQYVYRHKKEAGKGRKKRPNFIPYARRHYEQKGLKFERREETRHIEGSQYPMSFDYLGLFDGVVEDGTTTIGVQVCSQENVTARIRKMCSNRPGWCGIPRNNLIAWLADGKRATVLYCYQLRGKGSKWLCGEREVTMQDVETVASGGRLKL